MMDHRWLPPTPRKSKNLWKMYTFRFLCYWCLP
jgi:hypothetical protein